MTASAARAQERLRDTIRRFMTTSQQEDPGPVTLSVEELATKYSQPRAAVQAALKSLANEAGRGVHEIARGALYEYRPVERHRKRMDTQVRYKAARFMRASEPGSLQPVGVVAQKIGTLPSSTSAALRALSEDPFLHIVRVGYGVYSYRPPAAEAREREEAEATPPPEVTPAVMPPRRREAEPEPEPEPAAESAPEPEMFTEPARWGEPEPGTERVTNGEYRKLAVTSAGIVLVEDADGRLYRLVPVEP